MTPAARGRHEREARRGARLGAARERLRRRLAMPVLRPLGAAIAVVVLLFAGLAGYAIRGGDGERTVALAPAPSVEAAAAQIDVRADAGTLSVRDLPELGAGRVYQAWVGTGGEIEPSTALLIDGLRIVCARTALWGALQRCPIVGRTCA